MGFTVEQVFNTLRARIPGVTALVLIGADGRHIGHAAVDWNFDTDTFVAEHATLLRIVQRTAADTHMGQITEHIMVSESAIVIARHLPSDHFAIIVCKIQEPLGRLRYELKRAVRDLQNGR